MSVCALKTFRETQWDKRRTQDTELDNYSVYVCSISMKEKERDWMDRTWKNWWTPNTWASTLTIHQIKLLTLKFITFCNSLSLTKAINSSPLYLTQYSNSKINTLAATVLVWFDAFRCFGWLYFNATTINYSLIVINRMPAMCTASKQTKQSCSFFHACSKASHP